MRNWRDVMFRAAFGVAGCAALVWTVVFLWYGLGTAMPTLLVLSLAATPWAALGLRWMHTRMAWTQQVQ